MLAGYTGTSLTHPLPGFQCVSSRLDAAEDCVNGTLTGVELEDSDDDVAFDYLSANETTGRATNILRFNRLGLNVRACCWPVRKDQCVRQC
jgi:hypothetical protein